MNSIEENGTSVISKETENNPEISDTIRHVVCFRLANEVFAVDIDRVREIIRITDITRIPHAPDFIKGAINLRGKIVPVIDLRKRFGFPVLEQESQDRRIIE